MTYSALFGSRIPPFIPIGADRKWRLSASASRAGSTIHSLSRIHVEATFVNRWCWLRRDQFRNGSSTGCVQRNRRPMSPALSPRRRTAVDSSSPTHEVQLSLLVTAIVKIASRLNPVTSGPSAPLKASALLDAYSPSLMPRSSVHQGMAAGLGLVAAEAIGLGVDVVARKVAPRTSPLAWRIGTRAVIAALGASVARMQVSRRE